jgi:5-formaminoimidazole-4-carboxamide-1-beta-D-ribofuranosyl 5'-monophosphate synthetase
MKKLTGFICFALMLGISSVARAQDADDSKVKHEVKHGAHEVKKGAKKAGNKTAEVASKGKAKVTDQVYKDKVGPNGETIYMDNHSKYYWVDKKGHRHYVTEPELKAKAE